MTTLTDIRPEPPDIDVARLARALEAEAATLEGWLRLAAFTADDCAKAIAAAYRDADR